MTDLKIFLDSLFENLQSSKLRYAVVGNYENLPDHTSNDVDIWVENIEGANKILKTVVLNQKFEIILKNNRANGINYLIRSKKNKNINIIKIDFLLDASFKSIFTFIDSSTYQSNIKSYKNFKVINNQLETVIHFLHPLINKKNFKEKYKTKILTNYKNQFFTECLLNILGKKNTNYIIDALEKNDWMRIQKNIKKFRFKIFLNSIFKLLTYVKILRFLKTGFSRIFKPSGYVIAFVGPDGVGKTTIINEIEKFSEDIFLKGVTNFYWRPFLIPPIHKILFSKKNKSEFGSQGRRKLNVSKKFWIYHHLKFYYYLLDFIFGRLKYFSKYSRGGLIVFDRYYQDMMIYCERFGFYMNRKILSFFYIFINKPNITFYLHAPAKVLVERKKELSYEEIKKQHLNYMNLCSKYSNIVDISTNRTINEVKEEIMLICFSKMGERYK